MLIGIAGKMGSGKDYVTSKYVIPFIERELNQTFLQLAFADQIKVNVMTKYNVHYEDVYVSKTKETRRILQLEGTENGRNLLGKDVWINYHRNWANIFQQRGINHVIIPDVRFKNEINYIKEEKGFVIKVVAPQRNHSRLMTESQGRQEIYNELKSHISECDLDDLDNTCFDVIVNNDYVDVVNKEKMFKTLQQAFDSN